MNRRSFLAGAATGGAIGVLDWLGWFRRFGVPGTSKSLGLAEASAQAAGAEPRFLITWFQEGGWDSYSMFSPVDTPNHAAQTFAAGTLNPSPPWSAQRYRPKGYPSTIQHAPKVSGGITYGYLAQDGLPLLPDMCVVSSHLGNTFHSGGRWENHYGKYASYTPLTAKRNDDERSYMQAFAEAYGAQFPVANVSWHRWLSDGELSEPSYPEGTGYYEKLGPAYAQTIYGKTPADMRARLAGLGQVTAGARQARIQSFVDNLNANFISGKSGESVKAFDAAVKLHKQYTGGTTVPITPATLFTDAQLKTDFNVKPADENTNSTSINGNPARSKESPETNVQALMAYEMLTKGLSAAFWIENRQIRGFDSHRDRNFILNNKGQADQLSDMKSDLWSPLKALVSKLKATPYGTSGKSYYDYTTIVLSSEMGRTVEGDVASILASTDPDATKYQRVLEQDCCQHWKVSSVAFLGGTVNSNSGVGAQFGRVGTSTLEGIPIDPLTGALDPAFDPITGLPISGRTPNPNAVVTDSGHVYATALYLSGFSLNAANKIVAKAAGQSVGRNNRVPLKFVKKA
jgi:Protein of unknown function (DUF1501)